MVQGLLRRPQSNAEHPSNPARRIRSATPKHSENSEVLPSGSVDILLLKALSWGPRHGFAISRWVRERSDEALALEDAALYQGLHRLHRQGAIESEWGPSENNRRARFYRLTPAGRRRLREETAEWRALAKALFQVLDARSAGA